jgi:hypothetical protein
VWLPGFCGVSPLRIYVDRIPHPPARGGGGRGREYFFTGVSASSALFANGLSVNWL